MKPASANSQRPLRPPRKSGGAMPKGLNRPVASELESSGTGPQWTFLTNHSHVLVLLSRNPSIVLREVALRVGITERAVQRIIADLEAAGFIEREKIGRQNHYHIRRDRTLRHPIESHCTIGELLDLLNHA